MAQPSHRQTKARDLLAAGNRPLDALPLSFPCSLPELAGRRRHEPACRACIQARPPGRPACCAYSAKLGAFWKSIPEVDEVVSFAPADSVLSIAERIRGRFDAAMLFPNSFRSAAEAWLAGIPRRVGFRGHFRSMLLTQIIDEPKKKKAARPKHQADRYWHIAERCGAVEPPPLPATPSPAQADIVLGVCPGASFDPPSAGPPSASERLWNSSLRGSHVHG